MKNSHHRSSSLSRRGRSTSHSQQGAGDSRRLRFESLEDRRMLAVITVDSLIDNTFPGSGVTLRAAITAANTNLPVGDAPAGDAGADTIRFAAALSGQTIPIFAELAITETLTIDATALANNVTIDAQQNSRVLNFTASTGDLTLSGLTITGGQITGTSDGGGGIRFVSDGTLTLNSSTVSGNSTTGDFARGGGIFTDSGAVTLTNSTVSGNSAAGSTSSPGGGASGGGIRTNSGDVTLTSSTVSGNSSTFSGITIYGIALGGGIRTNSGAVTLTGSTVSDNDSGFGGGIRTSSGDVTLTSSTVSGNDSADRGGGILSSSGDVRLTGSTVTGNTAAGAGGGIYLGNSISNPALTIANSIVAGNTAGGTAPDLRPAPGGALNVDFSLIGNTTGSGIDGNTGSGNILNQSAQLGPLANNGGPTLTHALLFNSPAIDKGDPGFDVGAIPNDQRGAPFLRGVGARVDIGAYERQTVAGLNLTVDTNLDESDGDTSAGDLSLREAVGLANGSIGTNTITFAAALSGQTITLGGTELAISQTLTIDATALADNVTIDANSQSRVLHFSASTGDFTLSGLTITGGQITGTSDGGGIRFRSNGTLTLNSSTVSGNDSLLSGGGIRTSSGDVTLTSSTVSGNDSDFDGGGIRTSSGDVTLTNSTVSGNDSDFDGGGIFTSSGDVTLTNSTVSGNDSGLSGGGISTSSGEVTLSSSTVSSNDSAYRGGGILTFSGAVTLTGSTVSGNDSGGDGGGIRTSSGAVTLTGSTVSDNSTTGSEATGGGIYTNSGAVTLTDSTVSGNSTMGSGAEGGGIYSKDDVSLINSTLSGNSTMGSGAEGGGIYSRGLVTLTSSTVSGNRTTGNYSAGGGIWTLGGATVANSTVSGNSTTGNFASGGGIRSSGAVTLASSTVTENYANASNAVGGGIWNSNDPINITNSILAGNTAGGGSPDIHPGTGSLNVDFSLIGDTAGSGITVGTGNILNEIAGLAPLANNGGPTLTHALLANSPAIDAGAFSSVLSGNPLAYYRFEETSGTTANDSSGNGNDGTFVGGVTLDVASASPDLGRAASFDGIDDYVIAALDPSETDYTVTMWFRADADNGGLFSVTDGAPGSINSHDRHIYLDNGDIAARTWSDETITSSGIDLFDGGWHHVVHVFSQGQFGQRLFIDGQLVAQGAKDASDFNFETSILVGYSSDAANDFFAGTIDEVAIYDRALSTAEILAQAQFFDQRGAPFVRVFGGQIDIGAFEVQPVSVDSADFDNDGDIDGADFLAWQRGFGTTTGAAKADGDADNDGAVDGDDLGFWEAQFGGPAPLAAAVESGQSAVGSEPVATATQSVVVSPIVVSQVTAPSLAMVQLSSEPVIVSATTVAPLAPSPAIVRSDLVDLALAFALQDQADFVQQAKTSLATPVLNREADIAFLRRDDDVTRPASKSETSATTTRPDADSSDIAKRRDAWEDAFDEVFAGEVFAKEVFAEGLETV